MARILQYIFYNASCLLIILASCKKQKPFAVKPPEQAYIPYESRHSEVSFIAVPFEVSLDEIELKINKDLGTLLYEDNSLDDNGGDNLMLRVTKRSPIQISPANDGYMVKVPINIWAKAGWKIEKFGLAVSKYEDTQFDIDINFLTKITVSETWGVQSKTTPAGYQWVSKPFIRIGFFEVPIARIIEKLMDEQLTNVTKTIDKEVSKISFKPQAEMAWRQIHEPVLINDEYQLWLKVTPKEWYMKPPKAAGRKIIISMGMKAITETYVGRKPPIINPAPLPNLKIVDRLDEKFEVALVNEIAFDQARKLVLQQLKDQEFAFNNGKQKVRVTDIDLWGLNENLIIAATLVGSLNGKVYLKGEPYYNPVDMTLRLKNIDYDLDTKNKLLQTADWLAHDQFIKKIEPYLIIPIKEQINQAKDMITASLSNSQAFDKITLKGRLDQLTPHKILVVPGHLQAIIKAEGRLDIAVKGLHN